MPRENDEVKSKRIRKRKAMRIHSSDNRRKWKAGLKTAAKQWDNDPAGRKARINRYDGYYDDWLDEEEVDTGSSR